MKKLFLLAVIAAVAMSSCSSNENEPTASNAKAISFGTYVGRSTRGSNAVLTTTYPTDGSFMVLGYNTGTKGIAAASTYSLNYMRSEVTFDGTNYNYFPVKYWPDTTTPDSISFFAIHPAMDVMNTLTPQLNGNTLPSVDFTVKSDPLVQADLMMSCVRNQQSGQVSFAFAHQLTRVSFSAQLAADYNSTGDYIHITSIVVGGVNNEATFTFGKFGNVIESTPTGTANFTLNSTANLVSNGYVSSTTSAPVNLSNSYLLMIPADYSSSNTTTITVTYDVESADGTKVTHVIANNVKDVWKSGTAINYNMTISLSGVTITTGAAQWSE